MLKVWNNSGRNENIFIYCKPVTICERGAYCYERPLNFDNIHSRDTVSAGFTKTPCSSLSLSLYRRKERSLVKVMKKNQLVRINKLHLKYCTAGNICGELILVDWWSVKQLPI